MIKNDKDQMFLSIAKVLSTGSTCARRKVGCVLTDSYGKIIATGYNGVASGLPHCTDIPCNGARSSSGSNLDVCEAIHAEQNALLQCRNVREIDTCYTTTSPCMHCAKMLLNTSCKRIVFVDKYESTFDQVNDLWIVKAGREIIQKSTMPMAIGDELIELIEKIATL